MPNPNDNIWRELFANGGRFAEYMNEPVRVSERPVGCAACLARSLSTRRAMQTAE